MLGFLNMHVQEGSQDYPEDERSRASPPHHTSIMGQYQIQILIPILIMNLQFLLMILTTPMVLLTPHPKMKVWLTALFACACHAVACGCSVSYS